MVLWSKNLFKSSTLLFMVLTCELVHTPNLRQQRTYHLMIEELEVVVVKLVELVEVASIALN